MTTSKRRHQLFADRKLQGALIAHTAIYWFYCLFSVTLIAVCWIIFKTEPQTSTELFTQLWLNCGPALLGPVLLLPLVMMDCLRLSNKFAGPMVRMQRVMRELAAGETPPAFELRPGDYWGEFADNMNIVMDRIREQSPQATTSATPIGEPVVNSIAEATPSAEAPATEDPVVDLAPIATDGPATAQSIYSEVSL